jgi:hypothetical protein
VNVSFPQPRYGKLPRTTTTNGPALNCEYIPRQNCTQIPRQVCEQVTRQVPERVCLTVPRQDARNHCMNVTVTACDVVERQEREQQCDVVPTLLPSQRVCQYRDDGTRQIAQTQLKGF